MEIINDRVMAEKLLKDGPVEQVRLLKQLTSVILYCVHLGKPKEDVVAFCKEFLRTGDPEGYVYTDEWIARGGIESFYENVKEKGKYKGDCEVDFTESEMNYINSLPSLRPQKILFTIMALLRLQNLHNPNWETYINSTDLDIFRLSGCKNSNGRERKSILRILETEGALSTFVKIDRVSKNETKAKVCYQPIKIESGENEKIYKVNNIESFGKQWVDLMQKNVFYCQCCGQRFEGDAAHPATYCRDCFKELRKKYIAEKVAELRKRKKENKCESK